MLFLLPAFVQCSSVCTRLSQLFFDASCFFLLEFKLMWRLHVSFCSFLQKLHKKGDDQSLLFCPLHPWKTQSRGGKHWMMRGGGYFTRPWELKHNTIQPQHWIDNLLISLGRVRVVPYLTNLSISFWEGNIISPQIGLNQIFIELLQWKSTELGRLSKRKVSLQHSS